MKRTIVYCVVMSFFSLFAETWTDPETGRTWSYRMIGDTAEITQGKYSDWTVDLTIPSEIDNVVVTSIGDSAFQGCNGLTGCLTIPNSVTNIGPRAFYKCSGLTSVTLPDKLMSIEESTFYWCSNLVGRLILPGSVRNVAKDAFFYCKGLTEVTFPDSVTNIGNYAFCGCYCLKNVTISSNVVNIGERAFDACYELTNLTIMDGVKSIGRMAFRLCGLESLIVPDSVESIGENILQSPTQILYLSQNYILPLDVACHIIRYNPILTVSFDSAGGDDEEVESISVKVASRYGTLPIVLRENYSFEGWYLDGTRVTKDSIVRMVEDHTLVARWKPDKYVIGFDCNGGMEDLDSMVVTFDMVYGDLPTPTRIGHSFDGWFCNGGRIANDTIVVTPSNHVLTAHWTVNQYPMTFNANGGDGGCTLLQEYGTPVVVPEVSRVGYSLAGWNPSVLTNVPAEALEFVTQWSANHYEVSFDTCGGKETFDTVSRAYDGKYGDLPAPTREGYSFMYWSLYGSVVNSDTVLSMVSNHVLTAVWQGNEYGVTLDANGGIVEPPIAVVVYGDKYGDLPFAVRSGYSFEGWQLGEQLLDADTVVSAASNHTIVAQWTPCQYQVSFDADGGVLQNGQSIKTVIYDDVYGELPEATRVGYTFAGWELYGQKVLPGTMVSTASNHILTACWSANRYLVELNPNGGTLNPNDSTIEVVFDSEYGELPCPERIGYSFAGWTASLVDIDVIEPDSLATTNQILYALWEANPYQVVYEANNGSGETDSAYAVYDEDVEIAANPFVWMGHVFVGWSTSADGEVVYEPGQIVRNLTSECDGEVTLYAVWEPLVVVTPVITPGDGSSFVGDTCLVTISCATDGADIYFSTRGTPPRIRESYRYTGAFEITDTTCVMAIALKENVTSEVAVVTISRRELTIPEAAGAMELTFETGGDADWVPMADVSAASGYSVRSGAIGCASYGTSNVTWLATEVEGAGTFSFRWKVDCEHDYTGMYLWDRLVAFTNGVEAAKIDGSQDWADVSLQFADIGRHSIRWLFLKDDEDDDGASFEDCAWVSGVKWTPAIVVADTDYDIGEMPESVTVQPGVALNVKVESEPTEGEIATLAARVTISPKSPEQKVEYFKVVGSYDSAKESIVLKVVIDEEAIDLAATSQEVLDAVVDQAFAGGEVSLSSAKQGLYYGIVVVDDLSKMKSASAEVKFVKADESGIKISIPKPQGPSAFFEIIVSDVGNE